MAATQAAQSYPHWLTESVTTVTDINGVPLTTSTTILYLPLTYYGPSIPLGSLWTYGGLTSPATTSIIQPTATDITSIITTSAIPSLPTTSSLTPLPTTTSLIPLPTTSAIPSSDSSVLSSSTITLSESSSIFPTSSSESSSSGPEPTVAPGPSGGISRGNLIGIILGSLIALILIFFIIIACIIFVRRRRRQQAGDPAYESAFSSGDFVVVTPYMYEGEGRPPSPGEGSPRHSGEEYDPFLQRNVPTQQMQSTGAGPVSVTQSGSMGSSNQSSAASGYYGTVLARPTLSMYSPPPEQRRGNILTPEQLRRLDEETVLPPNTDFGPTMPAALPPYLTKSSSQHSLTASLQADADEPSPVTTARRVKMENASPTHVSPPPLPFAGPSTSTRPSSWKGLSIGIAGLAKMFRSTGESTSSRRHSNLMASSPLSDQDIESARALLPSETTPAGVQARLRVVPDERPISTVSGKSAISTTSGNSVYHDAQVSIPGTPLLTPLPRALAPPSQGEIDVWHASAAQAYPRQYHDDMGHSMITATSTTALSADILDTPAPQSLVRFGSTGSIKPSSTSSSAENLKAHPFPPGLIRITTPQVWNETAGATPSPGSYAANSAVGSTGGHGTLVDVLEEAPPMPTHGWQFLSNDPNPGHRLTFGGEPRFGVSPDYMSEQGSYHSHLSPPSTQSAGSAPASRHDQFSSLGSSSSGHRSRRTEYSGLTHSNSISSDDRRRPRVVSPAVSAFGPISPRHSRRVLTDDSMGHPATIDDTLERPLSPPGSPRSPLLSATPWAGGLAPDWDAM